MYKHLIRPLFFLVDPEKVHHQVVSLLKFGMAIPGIKQLVRCSASINDIRLHKVLFGLHFDNPVGIAAGFDKNAECYNELADLGFGFIEIGTVTPKGQQGNPVTRLFRLPVDHALINRMGFNNRGLEAAVENLKKRRTKAIIGGNLGKNTLTPNTEAVNDYVTVFNGLFDYVDYFVVNVSCPNISDLRELQDQEALINILEKIQHINKAKKHPKPILLKVSPDLNEAQLDEVIDLAKNKLIDGVVAVNTTITRNGLTASESTIKHIGNGGLSGKPLKQRATEVIRYLSEKSGKAFPIIGVGGIETPEDAIEKLEAGADLIQVYTGFIYEGPFIAKKINRAIIRHQNKNI
ncbi:MAG: dihydroorotate dehydrogenase (quinone) [Bacteroidetes bacterium HGW-Bacteroidetes-16]|jgi:dihydroorotate dehydrogenase|nr:MAG: dihydroorotate dehydrogenase (quinone) [Bacteroidetes bacterium HGW-Bacteroidetes-16]